MFPQHILHRFIKPFQRLRNSADVLPSNNESRFYKLPYVGKFSTQAKTKIKNIISKYCKPDISVRLIFTSNKICSYFSLKDSIPREMLSNVVYKFTCANCNVCYIGETTQQFITRINQHLFTDVKSAVYKHLHSTEACNASCNSESFSIIDRAPTEYQLRIKEALHIRKLKPELNRQVKFMNVVMSL